MMNIYLIDLLGVQCEMLWQMFFFLHFKFLRSTVIIVIIIVVIEWIGMSLSFPFNIFITTAKIYGILKLKRKQEGKSKK